MTDLITPDTNPEQKVRHGCLTVYLIFLIFGGLGTLYTFYGLIQSQAMSLWQMLFEVSVIISNIIWIIALFKWKKWGFWGWCLTVVGLIIYNLIVGDSIVAAFYPLVGLGILYGVLQIGGENKGWNQLEGFGTTKILDPEDSGLTEQEDDHHQQTSTAKEEKTAGKRAKVNIWDILAGSITGLIGVFVGSFPAAVALNLIFDEGWEYVFLMTIITGYPLIGALFGALGVVLIPRIFRHEDGNVDYPRLGVTYSIVVGFIIGILAGIAPYILLSAWYGLDEVVRDIIRASPRYLQVWWQH